VLQSLSMGSSSCLRWIRPSSYLNNRGRFCKARILAKDRRLRASGWTKARFLRLYRNLMVAKRKLAAVERMGAHARRSWEVMLRSHRRRGMYDTECLRCHGRHWGRLDQVTILAENRRANDNE